MTADEIIRLAKEMRDALTGIDSFSIRGIRYPQVVYTSMLEYFHRWWRTHVITFRHITNKYKFV